MSAKCPPQNWADIEKSRRRRQNVRPLSAVLSGVLSAPKGDDPQMTSPTTLTPPNYASVIAAAPKHEKAAAPVAGVTINPADLIPSTLNVYRFQGSLTTPPCSEGVNWHVAQSTVTASADQLRAMATLMGNNARPLQPLNGRLVVAPAN